MEFLVVLIAVMGAFYFILLRPVMRQQRQLRRDISNLGIGDEVLTTGGFFATVKEINTFEDRPMEIMLEAGPGVVLRGTSQAIHSVARRLADEEPEADEVDDDDEDWDDEEWEDEDLDDEDFDEDDWDDDDDAWKEDEDEDDDAEPRLQLTQRRDS